MNEQADVRRAAQAVLDAADAYRASLNGDGHPGESHDRELHHDLPGDIQVFEAVGDCSACGGAQYGCEDDLNRAYGALRVALGHKPLAWEQP